MFPWSYGVIIAVVVVILLVAIAIKIGVYLKENRKGRHEPLPQTRLFRSTRIGSPMGLAVFRVFMFLYAASLFCAFLAVNGINQLRFYTVWNYVLFIVFFGLASFVSAVEVGHFFKFGSYRSSSITPITELGKLVQILYQMALPMTVLVTAAQWGVMLPLAEKAKESAEYMKIAFFNIWGYNMHGINVFAMAVEFALNVLPMEAVDVCYVIMWPCAYAICIFILNATMGGWPYSIVNTSSPEALGWYGGLFLAHILLFFFWYGLSKVKLSCSCAKDDVESMVLNWGTKGLDYDHDERSRLLVKKRGDKYEWKTNTHNLYGEYGV